RPAPRPGGGGPRVPARQSIRRPRLSALSQRTRASVDPLGRSPGQARGAAARRPRLLPVVADLGPRMGAGAGGARWRAGRLALRSPGRLAAGARAAVVPRLHGPPGALLRALGDADPADRLPARRFLHRAG